jgi:hypothetical protein
MVANKASKGGCVISLSAKHKCHCLFIIKRTAFALAKSEIKGKAA